MTLVPLLDQGGDRVVEHAPFGSRTTYRVGGTVRALVTLSSIDDLTELGPLIGASGYPWRVLGNGSNLLVADGEHELLGIALDGDFTTISWRNVEEGVVVNAGAAVDLPIAARRLASAGVTGFEWAVGVPGTFGGAAVMNAGGHGSDMSACVDAVHLWDGDDLRILRQDELSFGYRTSAIRTDQLVTSVSLRLGHGAPDLAHETIREIVRWRRANQPGGANAGSVFRNPEGDHAARLIEGAGWRGRRLASAMVSEKHANFIIADPDGRANDVFDLLCAIRDDVCKKTGVLLHTENRFIGFAEDE